MRYILLVILLVGCSVAPQGTNVAGGDDIKKFIDGDNVCYYRYGPHDMSLSCVKGACK